MSSEPAWFNPGDMSQIEEEFGDEWRIAFFGASVLLTHREREAQFTIKRAAGEHIEDFMGRMLAGATR